MARRLVTDATRIVSRGGRIGPDLPGWILVETDDDGSPTRDAIELPDCAPGYPPGAPRYRGLRWYGTSATIVFGRVKRRSFSLRAVWLWSRFSHQ